MVSRLPLGLVALICMLALSATGTTVPVSHAATATSFTFAVGGDHGDSLTTGDGAASLGRLATSGSDFYLAIGDLSYINTTTGDTWCSQFKSSYNNVEVLAGNHDTGEENGTAATRSYERYVTGCPYTLTTSVPNCGPVLLNCYGKEYYFDYPAVNPIARFIMISPVVFNVTGVCSVDTHCNSAFGSPCDDLHGCWGYNKFTAHYNWVSSTIDNARTSSTIKWVVVGMHKVCISAGDQSCNIGPDLLNLMISKKVDLVLEGHDHSYQRSKQLALNTSTCTGITTASSFPIYNSNCVVNDGSAGVYTPGAGTVVVIQGTFGAAYNTVNDPSINGGASAAEAPYFAKLMGTNTPGNGHGFMQYTMTSDRIDAKSSFSGSFQDSFTIGKAFAISSSPSSLVFQAGSSGSSTVTIASQGGFTGTVSLSLSQTGCACTISSINPTSVDLTTTNPNASTILQVSGTFAGNVTLIVTGTSGAISFSTQVVVSVQDFSISTTKPSLTLNFNASDTSPINLASLNNFAGTVILAPTVSPSGLTFSLSPLSIPIPSKGSGSATLSVTGSAPGNYTVTVGAASGPTSHALVVKVRVLGDFTLSPTKTAMTLSPGSVDSSIIITLIGSGKYSGTVNLSAAVTPVTPSGPTASLALTSLMLKATTSSDGTNSTILTVNAGMVSGTYTISITATSGLLSHSTVITLTVTQAHPIISTTPSSSTISAGGSASDSALLTGATTTADGTVTYRVFSGSVCSGAPIFIQTVSVTNGVVPSSRAVQFNATGSFEWQATYSGDANNAPPPPTSCGSELLTVKVTTTTVTTALSSASIVPGAVVSDSATLAGFFGGFSSGGTATYSVFAGTGCTGTPAFIQTVSVNSVNGAIPNSRNVQFNTTGTFQWQVTYNGDANNGISTSLCGSESLSVGKATPSITTALSPNSIVVGNSAADTATVTGGTTPTGTVTFSVYSDSICTGTVVATKTVPLASGSAGPVRVVFNSTGTFNWQAVYNGDASNNIASSACGTETLTVGKAAPIAAESLSATTIIVGNSASANATVSGGFSPGGTVTFSVFTGSSCSGTLLTGGTIALVSGTAGPFSVIFNSTGTFSWQAAYNGDANNNPNNSPCKSLVVGKASPVITTSLSSTSIQVGSSVSDSASMTGSFQAGGTVTYRFFGGSVCSGTSTPVGSPVTVAGGVVPNSISQSFNSAGPYSWNAAYSGDANNNLATSPCESLTVNKANPTITTALSQNVIIVGSSVTDSATLTNNFQAGGTVTYSFFSGSTCGGAATVVGSPVAVSNGIVPNSASKTFDIAGPYSWNAVYSGDVNNNVAISACEPLTVNQKLVSITTSLSATTITVGSLAFDSATITGATSTAGGTVSYNLFTSGTCSGSPSVVSTVTVTNAAVPNSRSVTFNSTAPVGWNAVYSGDSNNSGATSACEPLTVNKTSPTISTSLSINPITVGQSITQSATLTGGFQAGGSVTYLEFSTGTCSGSNTPVSTVTVTNSAIPSSSPISPVPSGTYGFEASYSGDANNNPITSPCASLTVNKANPTITTSLSLTAVLVGSSVSDSATMTGGFQVGGTVTYVFFVGSSCNGTPTTVGSPVAVSNGVVPGSTSQAFNNAGAYSWNAAYSGDSNNNQVTSPCEPLTVNKASPTISTNLSPNPVTVGGSVSDFATMTGGFQAGGSATYFLFSTADCTGSKNQVSVVSVSNGVIPSSTPQTFSSAGPSSWNVGYSGDSNNNASTSPCEPLTVNKAAPAISSSLSQTVITVGNSVSDSATITNSFQASGTVAYDLFTSGTCSGSPSVVSTVTVTNAVVPNSRSVTFNSTAPVSWNAAYSGDANNNLATSTCEPLTVNPKGVALATSLSLTTIAVGSSAYDSAALTGSTSNAGGTVTYNLFSSGTCTGTFSAISQVTVASSTIPNSRPVIFNSTTAFSWNAVYSGDASNSPATSLCEPLTVNKANPTLATTVSATSATIGTAFHDSAALTGAFNAGGTVSYNIFSNNACSGSSTPVGSPVVVVGGVVPDSASITPSPAGSYSFQASYSGDTNNNVASSACEPFAVNKASPTVTTTLSANSIIVGGSASDSAVLAGGFSTGGTVTYSYFQGSVCAGPGTTVGLPVTMTGGLVPNSSSQTFSLAGPYSWNAIYNGDANNNAAASACEPLTVTKASPTISTSLSQNPIPVGTSVFDSATMTVGFQAGGSVSYNLFTGGTCSGSPSVVSTVIVTNAVVPNSRSVTFNSTAPVSWNAAYSGDANNNLANSPCEPLTVNPKGVAIATSLSSTTITVGGSVFDSAVLTNASGSAGGTVNYNLFNSGTCSGSSTLVSTVTVTNGIVPNSRLVTFNSTAAFSWNAVYSGDPNNSGAPSPCEPLTVNKTSPTISTLLSTNPITVGQSITESGTLTGSFQAGGSVTYLEFATGTCSGSSNPVSTVAVTNGIIPGSSPINPVPSGTYGFEASYSGDANNNPITSPCAPLTVNKSSPSITTSLSLNTIPVGSSVSDSVTMTGGYQPGGTVTYVFFNGGSCTGTSTPVGSPTTVTNGVVPSSASQGFNNAGSYSWNAAYSGDANNNAITSPCESLTVNKASPAISTTLSANQITVGGSAYDSATMTGGFQAGGTVTYNWFTGGTCTGAAGVVSTVSVVNGGISSSTPRTFSSAGLYSWNAVYSGDANNNGSPSSCEPLTVNPTIVTISTALSSSSITVGGSVTDSATLTGVTSAAGGTVTYNSFQTASCTGTPAVVSTVTVTNGVVPGSASKIFNSAGSFSWNALYSGDSNNGGATGACEPLVVNQAIPSITTTVSSNNVPVGTLVHDSATLSNGFSAGGTVIYTLFSDAGCTVSGVLISTVTVTNGVVPDSSSTSPTPSGAYSFQASYTGDANNKPVAGACEPFNVLKASPAITTSLSLATIPVGSSVSDSVTMTGGYQPGGTVTYVFFVGSSCTGSSTTVGSPVAVTSGVVPGSTSQTFNSAGAYGWSAIYSGDANNNPITSPCEPLTVNKASPSISTTLSVNPIAVGGSVYDSAAMTGAFQGGGSATYFLFTTADCTGSAATISTVTVNLGAVPSSSPQQFPSAGSFSWNVHYFGDSNNNPAISPCEPLTVSKASPTISTNFSANPVTVGGSVSDFATMTGGFQVGGSATYFLFSTADCTGTKNQVSVVTVSNGVIPSSIPQAFNTAGSYSWNLGYSGDSNNNASTSPCEPLTVNKASPAISTSLSQNVIIVGNSVSDSATITNSFQAGGTVTYSFYTGSTCGGAPTIVGTPVTVTNGVVPGSSLQTFDTAGPFNWSAAYSGDANNNPATSACEPLTVNPTGVAIATSLSSGTVTVGGSVFDSAVLTGATGSAGGTVTYNLFSSGICSGSPSSISKVTVTSSAIPNSRSVIFNSTSPVSWNALYSGDANNRLAQSLCEPLTVNKAGPTLATTVSATSATIGSAFHDSATLTGAFNAGGTVSYSTFNNNVCSGSGNPVGSPVIVTGGVVPDSVSVIPSPAGPYSFQASYNGDANNNVASSACEPFVVNKASPTVTTTLSASSIIVGGSASDSATIASGFSPGGTVTYSYFQNSNCAAPGTTVGLPATITNGVAPNSSSQTFSSAGPYSWNAVYNGDTNNNAVASACEPFTVNKASPSISTTLSQNPVTVGGSVFDFAAMTGGFQAGGSVTYNWFTGGTCSGALTILPSVTVVSGAVPNSVSQTFNSAGPYSWNAVYSGDANNNGSPSTCEPLTVSPTSGATISTSLSQSTITVGGSVTDSATLTGVTSGAGGTVTYNSFQAASCTGTPGVVSTVTVINSIVPGSLSKTYSSAGSFSWNAVYSGDANNLGATSQCEPLTVNQASPGITTTLSNTNVPVGNAIYDSASLSNGFNAGGTVTYTLFPNLVCAGSGMVFSTVSVSNGVIPDSLPTSPAPAGGYSFKASYGGDPNNKAATSTCEPFSVVKVTPAITSNLSTTTVAVGSSVSDSATMTGGFQASGTVTYTLYTGNSCSGIPTPISTVTVINSVIPSSSPATPVSVGFFSWRVAYSGDVNNNPAASNCAGLVVTKTFPTVTSNLSFLTISAGDSVYDTATLTGSFQATGTVAFSFYSGSTCSGSGTVVGSPVVVSNGIIPNSASSTFNAAGPYSWNAAYSGDANNNVATSACEPLTVTQTVAKFATLPAGTITVGNSVSLSVSLIGTTSSAGGTVTYNLYASGSCQGTATVISTVPVTNGAVPSTAWQFTAVGAFGWKADYSGDPNNGHAISSCGPFTVNKTTPSITTSASATSAPIGSVFHDSAMLTGVFNAGGTVSYSIFKSNVCSGSSTPVGTPVTVVGGVVPDSASVTPSLAGPYSFQASYSGDANNNVASGACEPFAVSKASPTITTTLSASVITKGSAVSSSAILTGGFAAGGTLAYNQFSSPDCTGTPAVVANVTVSNNIVPISSSQTFATDGKFGWNAIYSGDPNNGPATASCKALTVTAPPLLSVPGLQTVNSGSFIRFTVNATDPSWNNITITASGLPSGAIFPGAQSHTGQASSSFSWTPSDAQASADYKVTFTTDDGHGGVTSSQVTIHVNGINRSSPLANAIPYIAVALVAGTAVVLSIPLLYRRFTKRRSTSAKQTEYG